VTKRLILKNVWNKQSLWSHPDPKPSKEQNNHAEIWLKFSYTRWNIATW